MKLENIKKASYMIVRRLFFIVEHRMPLRHSMKASLDYLALLLPNDSQGYLHNLSLESCKTHLQSTSSVDTLQKLI